MPQLALHRDLAPQDHSLEDASWKQSAHVGAQVAETANIRQNPDSFVQPEHHLADANKVLLAEHAPTASGPVHVHLRWEPDDLGPMAMHLRLDDHNVSGHLVVQAESARALLETQVQGMRERLQEAGVQLGGFDVRSENGGQQGPWQEGRPAPSMEVAVLPKVSGYLRATPPRIVTGSGAIDLMA